VFHDNSTELPTVVEDKEVEKLLIIGLIEIVSLDSEDPPPPPQDDIKNKTAIITIDLFIYLLKKLFKNYYFV
jgi:hypothetical protein